jgi:hypothetical protein
MNTILQVPQEIIEAAQVVSNYFEKQGVQEWQLCSIADRRLVTKLERLVRDHSLDAAPASTEHRNDHTSPKEDA